MVILPSSPVPAMASPKHVAFFPLLVLLFLVATFCSSIFPSTAAAAAKPRRLKDFSPGCPAAIKGGYWPTWSSSYPPSAGELALFTHVYYAFVQVDPSTFRLAVTAGDNATLRAFVKVAHGGSHTAKAMLSIGGAGGNASATFAALAADCAARSAFIASTILVAREYGLDGLDLDWEYPQSAKEMADFAQLLAEWRAAVEQEAAAGGGSPSQRRLPLLLSAAVYYSATYLSGSARTPYPVAAMAAGFDWINVMSYDLHGAWDATATGAHAPLYDPKSNLSASYGVKAWVAAGMPAEKVVMGLPLYGRTYNLTDPRSTSVNTPASGVGPGDLGVLRYAEVVAFNRNSSATVVHDETMGTAYSYAGRTWISYDDPWSVMRKTEFGQQLGLRGYFFWAIGDDEDWSISRTAWGAWGC